MMSFSNADLFTSVTVTASAGGNSETVTVLNPQTFGNSPEQPNLTPFNFNPPLMVPPGTMAMFSAVACITSTPNITMRRSHLMYAAMNPVCMPIPTPTPSLTMRRSPLMYAAMIPGDGFGGSGGLLASMLLLSLGTTLVSKSRPRRMFFALVIVLLAMTSQVGCDNGSVGTSGPSSTAQTSVQKAKSVALAKMNGTPIPVAGFEHGGIVLSTISVP